MKKIFFSLLSLCLSMSAMAQMTLQPNVYQSPEISSLMRDVLSPVSLSSGTVNVNIPLYSLQKGSITVPISLNYDASGVRVDAQPSWAGQNWNLNSGGMISRVVKGIPDETYISEQLIIRAAGQNTVTNTYAAGYLFNNNKLNTSNWNTTTQIENWAKNDYCELEPDEFVFNFCGHSGVFYANEQGKIVVKGQKGWKIEPMVLMNIPVYDGRVAFNINNPDGRSYTYMRDRMLANYMGFGRWKVSRIMGFKVTDPNGIEYYFGQFEEVDNNTFDWYNSNLEGIEINADFFSEIFLEQFNAWHLRKIKAPNGDEVTFKYDHFWPTLNLSKNYTYSYMSGQSSGFGWIFGGKVSSTIWHAGSSLAGDILRPVYLTEIRTNDQLVTFTSSQVNDLKYNSTTIDTWLGYLHTNYADRYLYVPVFYGQKPIRVWTSSGNFVEYMTGARYLIAYGDVRKKKLDRIEVKSLVNSQIVKDYTFTYNQTTSTRLQLASLRDNTLPAYQFTYNTTSLPGYLSDQHDHWGYFNNRTPSYSNYSTFYTYREPNTTYTPAASLTQIKYPTGGIKKLIYEPHYYTRRVVRNPTSGALSLETVAQAIGGGLRIKEVHETDNSNVLLKKTFTYSPGILNGKPEYYWAGYKGKLLNGNQYTADRFYSQSLLPVSNNPAGGSVSYTTATEILEGNGKIEYTYANHDTRMDENSEGSIDPQKSAYYPLTSKDLERGMVTEIKYYAEGSTTPSKREQFTYYTQGSTEFIKAVYLRRLNLFGGMEVNAIEGTAYKRYVSPYHLKRKAEYYMFPGGIDKFVDYTYDYTDLNHLRSENLYSPERSKSTSYKYPYDYTTSVYLNMVNRNILTPVIETTVNKGSAATEKTTVNYSSYTGTSGTLYRPSTVVKASSRTGSTITDQLTFSTYDGKGNLVAGRDWDGQQKVYIWGYNGAYIVAEVTGVVLSSVTSANSVLSGIATTPLAGALPAVAETALRNLSNARVVSYDYQPLIGVSRITDVSGRTTTYNYDNEGRLSTVIDSDGHVIEKYNYNYKQ